jgi:hypothetical protein
MKTPNEQRGLFSRLPDDSEYWKGLTDRIVQDGSERLEKLASREPEWWAEIARYSTILAASAVAAVVACFLLIQAGEGDFDRVRAQDTYGLIPPDPLAVTLVARPAPPTIDAIIALRNAESER